MLLSVRLLTPLLFICWALFPSSSMADCRLDRQQQKRCGPGQCARDSDGNVYCAIHSGGGALSDINGNIVCGVGFCTKDYLGKVWCSKQRGGLVGRDSKQKVECQGSCARGTAKLCVPGR
ncbi:hypothetical protein Misp06_03477 [Microbulbifer sp. NBRC 101763]|uniref:hypothetical protein n=1 Tax=unclassified Microbulbifer TaxID=2619833 RepID=UPI0024AD4041|nr:hypothetical protein [Microbulbifer sp. MLAF003]WHI52853.1 hypothetical protein P3339_08850 [Microbulbifer sp. MLAF003]